MIELKERKCKEQGHWLRGANAANSGAVGYISRLFLVCLVHVTCIRIVHVP